MSDRIREYLEALADLEEKRDELFEQKEQLIDSAIPQEVKERIAAIEAEIGPKLDGLTTNITDLQQTIRASVKSLGQSIKSQRRHAVFSKGRVSWDKAKLEGYTVAHPEVLEMRKVGKPSVSIRKVKQ